MQVPLNPRNYEKKIIHKNITLIFKTSQTHNQEPHINSMMMLVYDEPHPPAPTPT